MFCIPLIIGAVAGAYVMRKKEKLMAIIKPLAQTAGHLTNEMKEALKDAKKEKGNDDL